MTHRVRRLRSLVERPADVWLIFRMAAWAAVLPLLKGTPADPAEALEGFVPVAVYGGGGRLAD